MFSKPLQLQKATGASRFPFSKAHYSCIFRPLVAVLPDHGRGRGRLQDEEHALGHGHYCRLSACVCRPQATLHSVLQSMCPTVWTLDSGLSTLDSGSLSFIEAFGLLFGHWAHNWHHLTLDTPPGLLSHVFRIPNPAYWTFFFSHWHWFARNAFGWPSQKLRKRLETI